jgi:DUF177 domain-containing protein
MKRNSDYIIHFKGLGFGKHEFNYAIHDEFFALFENSEIEKGSVKVEFILDKKSNFMEFIFNMSGTVGIPCDRCLDNYNQPIDYKGKIIVKFGEERNEISDEMIVLSKDDFEIDLKDYIYELIFLNIPLRKVHPDDEDGNSTCNQEMLNKLEKYTYQEESNKIDSRWSKLNDLTK